CAAAGEGERLAIPLCRGAGIQSADPAAAERAARYTLRRVFVFRAQPGQAYLQRRARIPSRGCIPGPCQLRDQLPCPGHEHIYQVPTRGYEAESTDYYLCAVAKQPLSSCPNANVSPGANFIQTGSRNLGFENGRSFDYGIVFS